MRTPSILYEDDSIAVIHKPSGLLVHRAAATKKNELTLADWIVSRWPDTSSVGDAPHVRPGIVHRLDRGTSGIMVIAKTQLAFDDLKRQFQEHTIEKSYLAVVRGEPKSHKGVITKPIGIIDGTVRRSVHAKKFLKHAETAYQVLKIHSANGGSIQSLISVEPKTGRTHQIRVHLASIGCPIVGDPLYGGRKHRAHANRRFGLHAHALTLRIPGSNTISRFESPPSADFFPQIEEN